MSPYLDAAIVEAGDDKQLIRDAYVNEQFFACVKAAPAILKYRLFKFREQFVANCNVWSAGGFGDP